MFLISFSNRNVDASSGSGGGGGSCDNNQENRRNYMNGENGTEHNVYIVNF